MEIDNVEMLRLLKRHLQKAQNIYDTLEAKQDLDENQERYLEDVIYPVTYLHELKTDTEEETA